MVNPSSVLKINGELVVWHQGQLDFSQLQRRVAGPSRVEALVRAAPASYVVFDVLQLGGRDLAAEPLRVRRRRLEGLLPGLHPPLQITPATRDFAMAQQWLSDYAAAGVGIEGLVIKGLAVRYQPGRRAWLKLRTRASAEAVVGAITGTLAKPERLILGLPAADGSLIVAGSTGPLKTGQQRDVAPYLQMPEGEHPWPANLPSGRLGVWVTQRKLPVILVEPSLVVEIDADAAYEHGNWRQLTHLIRVRPDLQSDELQPFDGDA